MHPISAKFCGRDKQISQNTGEIFNFIWITVKLPLKDERITLRVDDDNTQVIGASVSITEKLNSSIPIEKWMYAFLNSWKNRTDTVGPNDSYVFIYEDDKVDCFIQEINEELGNNLENTEPANTFFQRVLSRYGSFFKSDLKKIAFFPIDSYVNDRDIWNDFTTILGAIPYLAATIVTMLCAAVLAVLAGLSLPFALIGASVTDLFIPENEPSTFGI